jgi:ribulose bisphosphate carboxylase small subunit
MKQMMRKEIQKLHPCDFTIEQSIEQVKYLIKIYGNALTFQQAPGREMGSWYTSVTIDVIESDSDYENRKKYEVLTNKHKALNLKHIEETT